MNNDKVFHEEYLSNLQPDYFGWNISDDTILTLQAAIKDVGVSIFDSSENLRDELKRRKMSLIEINRICTITSVQSFVSLISKSKISVSELEVFITQAYEVTGFTKPVILTYISVILEAMGNPVHIYSKGTRRTKIDSSTKIDLNYYQIYKDELDVLRWNKGGERYSAILNELCHFEVPKALYIKGVGLMDMDDSEKGLEYIEKAANLGDEEASRYLGEYYYDQGPYSWKLSYDWYMSCSSAFLKQEDRENVISLINQRTYNKKMIIVQFVFVFLTFLLFLLIPELGIYSGQKGLGIVALVLESAVSGLSVFLFKRNAFISMYFSLLIVFAIWLVSLIIRFTA